MNTPHPDPCPNCERQMLIDEYDDGICWVCDDCGIIDWVNDELEAVDKYKIMETLSVL